MDNTHDTSPNGSFDELRARVKALLEDGRITEIDAAIFLKRSRGEKLDSFVSEDGRSKGDVELIIERVEEELKRNGHRS